MTLLENSPMLKTDAYKIGHMKLYPSDLTKIYSVLIPRRNDYFKWDNHMVVFGYQYYVQHVLLEDWQNNFFNQSKEDVVETWATVIGSILGKDNVDTTNIEALHDLGYLPIRVKALPEGSIVPMGVPTLTIENTDDRFPWLTNFLETELLATTFVTTTTASVAHQFRKVGEKWGNLTSDDLGYLDYQFHDFSERGQHGNEAGILSGMGHLTSFKGSDVLQATVAMSHYYDTPMEDGNISASVIASEHSVMESYGLDQYKTYAKLIANNPKGILSLVSDTYDYWEVMDKVLPQLHDQVMKRDGKVVIRPDSIDMPLGDFLVRSLDSLWDTFGGTVNTKGYKVLDPHVGLLYGEGITLDNVDDIFKMITDASYSAENIVLGVGAYVYSVLVSRDSFGQAIKAQVAVESGAEHLIYKDPKTDVSHLKRSLCGAVAVTKDSETHELVAHDNLTLEEAQNYTGNLLNTIFEDGKLYNRYTLKEVRTLLENGNLKWKV